MISLRNQTSLMGLSTSRVLGWAAIILAFMFNLNSANAQKLSLTLDCKADRIHGTNVNLQNAAKNFTELPRDGRFELEVLGESIVFSEKYKVTWKEKQDTYSLFSIKANPHFLDPNFKIWINNGELQRLVISVIDGDTIHSLSVKQDYNIIRFFSVFLKQRTQKESDELNIKAPAGLLKSPSEAENSIFHLSGICIKR